MEWADRGGEPNLPSARQKGSHVTSGISLSSSLFFLSHQRQMETGRCYGLQFTPITNALLKVHIMCNA